MTTATRYKYVKGSTVAYTVNTFPSISDGDDKQEKVVYRVLTAADIGNGAGQTGNQGDATHIPGTILAVLQPGQNVLCIDARLYRKIAGTTTVMTQYWQVDGKSPNITVSPEYVSAAYGYSSQDNTIRMVDKNYVAQPIAAGDMVVLRYVVGPAEDTNNVL